MKKIRLFFFLVLLLTSLLAGCDWNNKQIAKLFQLDTAFSIVPQVTICAFKNQFEDDVLLSEMNDILQSLDNKYNVNKEYSLITHVNNNAGIKPVTVDDEFIDIIKKTIDVGQETKIEDVVLYDVTVLPLTELWDFRNKYFLEYYYQQNIPKTDQIESLLSLVSYENIIINENDKTIFLAKAGMKIELGSIIKGYASDKINDYLISKNFTNYTIDIGCNVIVGGENSIKGRPWSVGVMKPFSNGEIIGNISAIDDYKTFVTSGVYERYIKVLDDPNIYHHILNPHTGYPMDNDLLSVTIVSKKSIIADAYSTAVFMMGLDEGLAFIESQSNLDAIFITESKQIVISSGLADAFVFNESIILEGYIFIN